MPTHPSRASLTNEATPERTIGLFGATGVGVGAIVGGGILVLAGVAFQVTGPSAIIAFGVNGIIAIMTALSFAEMSTSFPESGGVYTFAKKVLNARAAYSVGWLLWFAYIVAGVLYAIGFAEYAVLVARKAFEAGGGTAPGWLEGRPAVVFFALTAAGFYTVSLMRKAAGGGDWATWGKVVVFGLLIVAGFVVMGTDEKVRVSDALTPFFSGGGSGLLQAMGFTFIALQGFDLIAAVAGEVKSPRRNIPRAMLTSLGIALIVYLPLLFIVSTVGVEPGDSIQRLADAGPAVLMAAAVDNYLGATGYWLVVVAAILSTLSALQANLFAASRVALSMARDRNLPDVLLTMHATRRTPVMAIFATALALTAIVLMVPDVAAAGAAASLIFLMVFALSHWTAFLARRRGRGTAPKPVVEGSTAEPFRAPWFPVIPIVGGVICAVMAVFQAFAVPAAGAITLVWLGLGALLYTALFGRRSKVFDAYSESRDPELVRLRGQTPFVLLPVANPESAGGLVGIAAAIAPPEIGRVLLLNVMSVPKERSSTMEAPQSLLDAQEVLREAMVTALAYGHQPECLMTIASAPWSEIRRVARDYRCTGLVLGLGETVDEKQSGALESLLNGLDCDVTLVKAPPGFRLKHAKRILVPIGGRGGYVELRARLLGSLGRAVEHSVTWLTVLPVSATESQIADAKRTLNRFADDTTEFEANVEIVKSDEPHQAILDLSAEHDLLILGLQRAPSGRRVLGDFGIRVALHAKCATIMVSRGE